MNPITNPLIEPRPSPGTVQTIVTTVKRFKRLKEVARGLNVRRCPEGSPSVGALLDAIAQGRVALRRRDDPQEREFWAGMEAPGPKQDPRCPGDWS